MFSQDLCLSCINLVRFKLKIGVAVSTSAQYSVCFDIFLRFVMIIHYAGMRLKTGRKVDVLRILILTRISWLSLQETLPTDEFRRWVFIKVRKELFKSRHSVTNERRDASVVCRLESRVQILRCLCANWIDYSRLHAHCTYGSHAFYQLVQIILK